MSSENDGCIGTLIIIGILSVLFVNYGYDRINFTDEIIRFTQRRACDDDGNKCKWHNYTKTAFKVSHAQQSVIQDVEYMRSDDKHGRTHSRLSRLRKCIVRDKNNWSCSELEIVDGEWSNSGLKSFRDVTRIAWWMGD